MRVRRILFLLLGLLLLVSIPVTVYIVQQRQELRKKAAPATVLSIRPGTMTKAPDETFSVTVEIDTGENTVSAAEIVVFFDGNMLEAEAINAGDFLSTVLVAGSVTATTATITLGSPPTAPKRGSGTLATVSFVAKGATGTSQISFGAGTRVAGIGEQGDVLVGKTPGTVTIAQESDPTATPTPTPTPTPSTDEDSSEDPGTSDGDDTNTGQRSQSTSTTPSPTPTRAASAPLTLQSPPDGSIVKTNTPTLRGTADPNSTVTIVINSDPITGVVTANSSGRWSFTPSEPLPDGVHTVQVSQVRADGTSKTVEASITVMTNPVPVTGGADATLWMIRLGVGFLLLGFFAWPLARVRR